jgi:hypothetical protein
MTSAALLKNRKTRAAVFSSNAGLAVDRADIVFANITPERVLIEITVHNRGVFPTPPTRAVIQAAPLGAFVPWRPLASVDIPLLLPGDSHTLALEANPVQPVALGRLERVPPRRLRTALANDDDPAARTSTAAQLPADIFGLLTHANPHWAGNLNIFVGERAVERHLAQALRIYPGRTNLAMFVVGSRSDAYTFSLHGSGSAWDAELYDLSGAARIAPHRESILPLNERVQVGQAGMLMLALRPPVDAERGEVQVQVEQFSTGKTAVVEFRLDAKAAGPGCFVVP